MRRYRARKRGEDVPHRRSGPRNRNGDCNGTDLSHATLAELCWEVAARLDELGEATTTDMGFGRTRAGWPELDALTTDDDGYGPIALTTEVHQRHTSACRCAPEITIVPASYAADQYGRCCCRCPGN
jgi:hypothetical protein